MPKVSIESPSQHDRSETLRRVREMFEQDQELKKIDPDHRVEFDTENFRGQVTGSKFKAEIEIRDQLVSLLIDLPLMMSPFKGQIKSRLEEKLASALGS